jgi:hypothetical protein
LRENVQGGKNCGKLQIPTQFCAQPVEQPVAVSKMDMANYRVRAAEPADTPKLAHLAADSPGEFINCQRANQLDDELKQKIQHHRIMALIAGIEKTGKPGDAVLIWRRS